MATVVVAGVDAGPRVPGGGCPAGSTDPTEDRQDSGVDTLALAVTSLEGCGPAAQAQALLWGGDSGDSGRMREESARKGEGGVLGKRRVLGLRRWLQPSSPGCPARVSRHGDGGGQRRRNVR